MTEQHSILIIDDDRFLLDMYAKKFSEEGYSVEARTAVLDALRALEGIPSPAAIVFDLVMPQHDGFYLLEQLREQKLAEAALKVALTNQSAEEEQEKVKALGGDLYIVKASKVPSEVFNMVHESISKRFGA